MKRSGPRMGIDARYGMLEIVSEQRPRPGARGYVVDAVCDCGARVTVIVRDLRRGYRSCGCLRRAQWGKHITHGRCGTPEWRSWSSAKNRCTNPSNANFSDYGGRGIRFAEAWFDFAVFLRDMGPRPTPKHSLDRIDVNGNYEPGNCRWATSLEQNRNRRDNVAVTARGETMTVSAWAARVGLGAATLRYRIRIGWDVERALATPARPLRIAR